MQMLADFELTRLTYRRFDAVFGYNFFFLAETTISNLSTSRQKVASLIRALTYSPTSWRAECLGRRVACLRTNWHRNLIHILKTEVVLILRYVLRPFQCSVQAVLLVSRGVLARFRKARLGSHTIIDKSAQILILVMVAIGGYYVTHVTLSASEVSTWFGGVHLSLRSHEFCIMSTCLSFSRSMIRLRNCSCTN